ncbi:subtilase family protein [Pseudosporangium ferrugineum]|uniref:Subtilase family protein n=2 Tax=Pseudosporangium ferrugineum TaxID=439699 RepID=A0A2T0S812_9ACTN|nr:subtilase family protein [Pseudosporangium ferrugineum]
MSWITRTAGLCLSATVVTAALLTAATPASAADEEYVKYYTVTSSYQGKPENLTEIATRFLGSGARSVEIFNLNTGRIQPDKGVLTDPNQLHAGWRLKVPWDAVGAGLQYGVLSEKPPKVKKGTNPPPPPPPPANTTTAPNTPPQGSVSSPPGIPAPGTRPSLQPGIVPGTAPGAGQIPPATNCPSTSTSSTKSDWARLRVAADKAWPQSKGKGQLVAVVDSGVNGSLKQLSGHVSVGIDVSDDKGRGDSDCLGTGTAMAALLVAKQVKGEGPVGVAPDATVLPVRVVRDKVALTPEAQVKGINTAVAAGATVIALGSVIDATDTNVAKAIADAVAHDVVVILGAPTEDRPVNPAAVLGEGTVRVAGIGIDDQWALNYRRGAVDVVAPGINVTSLGSGGPVNGSGTHYAVALAAGEAALIRSAYPDLTAAQVTHRLKTTADRMGEGTPPHSQFGWGFLDPASAVTKTLDEEKTATPPAVQELTAAEQQSRAQSNGGGDSTRTTVLIVTVALMLAAAALLGYRIRQLLRKDDDAEYDSDMDLYDARSQVREPALAGVGAGAGAGVGGGAGASPIVPVPPAPSAGPFPPPPPPPPSAPDAGPFPLPAPRTPGAGPFPPSGNNGPQPWKATPGTVPVRKDAEPADDHWSDPDDHWTD